jgi:hypothetical protein
MLVGSAGNLIFNKTKASDQSIGLHCHILKDNFQNIGKKYSKIYFLCQEEKGNG